MNVFTSACLLIWSGSAVLHAIFAPQPWFGLASLAFSLLAWLAFSREDARDRRHFLPRTARTARRSLARRLFDAPRNRW